MDREVKGMKEQKMEAPELENRAGNATSAVEPEYMSERPGWGASQGGKGHPCKGMPERWEAQWQEFLKTLQPIQTGGGSTPVVPESGPWEDAKAFLASFEQVAKACRWPRGEWVARLLPALSGEAEEAFRSLEAGDREDYGKVKLAIVRGDALRMEVQRQHFRQFCCEEVKDPRRVYSQLQELCHQWLKPERHTKEQILELLILEQFLANLPPELQGWIRAGGPETCSQAVALAEEFLRSQQEAKTEVWQGLMNLKEMGVSLQTVKRSLTQPGQQTMVWQVLQEEDGENQDLLGDGKENQIKLENAQCGGSWPTDTNWTASERSPGNVLVAAEMQEEGDDSNMQEVMQPVERENGCGKLRGSVPAAIKEPSKVDKKGEMPLFSKYGRRYHYRSELLMKHVSGDYNECPRSEENIQQNLYFDEPQRIVRGEEEFGFSEDGKGGDVTRHQSPHGGNWPEDTPSSVPQISHGNGLEMVQIQEGEDESKMPEGIQPGLRENECAKLTEGVPGTMREPCIVDTRGEMPLFSNYGRRHRYIPELATRQTTENQNKCPTSKEEVQQHQRTIRGERKDELSEDWKGSYLTRCPSRHIEEESNNSSACGNSFSYAKSLNRNHGIQSGERPYECSHCRKCFSSREALIRHRKIHTGDKPHECSQCGKRFIRKENLRRHQNIHTGEKPHECSQCRKRFRRREHLKIHEQLHTGEKPHECPQCGKSFASREAVMRHGKIHTGEKPYKCSRCGKCFCHKVTLNRHQRTHTGEKPYSCSQCGKCFSERSDVKRHQIIHTEEKPYECAQCGKCFRGKANLNRHQRIHSGERCSQCGKCSSEREKRFHERQNSY
ncbi:zinc finger protein 345-like [Rhineura floridana]|uniref:zinc finger protein 345-like n=1 Tax=Rhineura floridana TaxID=261503 RepID=UPI002AC85859|nr:zinc finger protein 345-like [Rhineura floridana]XP_061475980.1 zinc finger protein 345-like [Rhineura floridana]XP_061475981.1 zinc finger protein 345-like [Rhineura floridana]XP_061475982.1 zinc finger protein 345-like [Rhineura floridana]XP_061475983.1 zinc finger protein 345-like [Rhineura floridana]